MILIALVLISLAVGDLVRWSTERVSPKRQAAALASATMIAAGTATLAGFDVLATLIIACVSLLGTAAWSTLCQLRDRGHDHARPLPALALILALLVSAFAASGSVDPAGGTLATWYENLAFPFATRVALDQFLIAIAACLFATASGNQFVRLVLSAPWPPARRSSPRRAFSGSPRSVARQHRRVAKTTT